jgi:hypothetical protein
MADLRRLSQMGGSPLTIDKVILLHICFTCVGLRSRNTMARVMQAVIMHCCQ